MKLKPCFIVLDEITCDENGGKYGNRVFRNFKSADNYALKLVKAVKRELDKNPYTGASYKNEKIKSHIGYHEFWGRKAEVIDATMFL